MSPRIPRRQYEILDVLRATVERDGRLPVLTDVARHMGITYPTLREHLNSLEAKGLIRVKTRGPGKSPDLELVGDAPERYEPVTQTAVSLPRERKATTAEGFLYVMQLGDEPVYKIGVSQAPERRLGEVQTGAAVRVRLLFSKRHANPYKVERSLHYRYAGKRVHGEWFRFDTADDAREMLATAWGAS